MGHAGVTTVFALMVSWLYLYPPANIITLFLSPEHTPKKGNQTPLYASVTHDHVEIVRILLDAGAKHLDTKGVRENMMGWMIVKSVWRVRFNTRIGLWVGLIVLSRNISFSLHIFTPSCTSTFTVIYG